MALLARDVNAAHTRTGVRRVAEILNAFQQLFDAYQARIESYACALGGVAHAHARNADDHSQGVFDQRSTGSTVHVEHVEDARVKLRRRQRRARAVSCVQRC